VSDGYGFSSAVGYLVRGSGRKIGEVAGFAREGKWVDGDTCGYGRGHDWKIYYSYTTEDGERVSF
jgi:hypothetical protein